MRDPALEAHRTVRSWKDLAWRHAWWLNEAGRQRRAHSDESVIYRGRRELLACSVCDDVVDGLERREVLAAEKAWPSNP